MADLSVTDTLVLMSSDANATKKEGTAGAAITRGQPVAVIPSTGRLTPADSSHADHHKVVGIALNDAATGQPLDYCTRDPLFVPGFVAVLGTVYVLGAAAGGIALCDDTAAPAASDYGVLIGVAVTTAIVPINFTSASWGGLHA